MRARLIAMVTPDHADYWSDELLFHAVEVVREIRASGEEEPLRLMASLKGGARARLLDAALTAENPEQPACVSELLAVLQLPGLGDEEIDLVIENVRSWKLKESERIALYEASANHAIRPQLLKHIIESL